MSDMETQDVPTPEASAEDVAPAAEPVAPEQPADASAETLEPTAEPVAETPADAAPAGPTVEELQAELANLQAEVAAVEAAEAQAKPADPVVVIARPPSSESATQQPEAAPEVEKEPVSLEDAALRLATLVRDRRTTGDADVDAALADVEAAVGQEIVSSSEAAIRAAAEARKEQDAQ